MGKFSLPHNDIAYNLGQLCFQKYIVLFLYEHFYCLDSNSEYNVYI